MFKGIIALFTSGAIFNPFVLLGIFSGAFAVIKLKSETIRSLFGYPEFYGAVAFLAVVYTVIFAKVYKDGGIETDWKATTMRMVGNFVRYFLSFVLTMSFIVMLSF